MDWMEIFSILLFFISLFGLIFTENIVKSVVCTMLMQTSVILFWLGVSADAGLLPPIGASIAEHPYDVADPLSQALMLTAIISGIVVVAINITMLNALLRKYKTIEWTAMAHAAANDKDVEMVL
jgi:multicomponent Na+:H+ antiporter subunit C